MPTKADVSPARHRLDLEDREGIALLRGVLAAAPYTEPVIRRALQANSVETIKASEALVIDRMLPRDGLLPALIRFFLCSIPADPADLARHLGPLTPERLQSLGLLRLGPAGAEPIVRFVPVEDQVLACEYFPEDIREVPADFVLGINPSSVALATLTIRRPFATALDLGCGCGIQSILAARHCARVVATDLNPRAVNFTAFNCLLNGIANVECRQGSLFEPVAGESFDLIVSNPPFVVSPDASYQFRDSGRPLDSFCRSLVEELPKHLTEGGYAQLLCSWVMRGGESWSDPLRAWISGSGCDALLLRMHVETPLGYASVWNRHLQRDHRAEFGAALDRWTEHFRRSNVEAVALGGLVLRRRSASQNWVAELAVNPDRDSRTGDHVLRIFEARDWLEHSPSDEEVLQSRFSPAGDLKLEQTMTAREGRLAPAGLWAGLQQGFRFRGEIDATAAQLLTLLDGRARFEEVVAKLRSAFDAPAEEIRGKALAVIRELCAAGFVVRA